MQTIITIDGKSATGKGTLTRALSRSLNVPFLDSGSIYRILGWQSLQKNIAADDSTALIALASSMQVSFELANTTDFSPGAQIIFQGREITGYIRNEEVAERTSIISQNVEIRKKLLDIQRNFVKEQGLIADGRDMGTVVFPNATLKLFLTAREEIRHRRRIDEQLPSSQRTKDKIDSLISSTRSRDHRDQARKHSPNLAAEDAIIVDTSELTALETYDQAMDILQKKIKLLQL